MCKRIGVQLRCHACILIFVNTKILKDPYVKR
jgi:hypothetical protein